MSKLSQLNMEGIKTNITAIRQLQGGHFKTGYYI